MLDAAAVRSRFPALSRTLDGVPVVYADGPGGTQVVDTVIEAVSGFMARGGSNLGGPFATSIETQEVVSSARAAAADLFGAERPDEIVFGQNMTSLTLALGRALARTWRPGDEIVCTTLDHDANVSSWMQAAGEAGATVRLVDFDPGTGRLDPESVSSALTHRTRLVAVTHASNAIGTVVDVAAIVEAAHSVGALVFVDAVHYAPHGLIDVTASGCDFLAASAYKFFGPHTGLLYGRAELLAGLDAVKIRPAPSEAPGKWESGTQSFESLAGVAAAVDYLASVGDGEDRRSRIRSAMGEIGAYEAGLSRRFLDGVATLHSVTVHGLPEVEGRTPTFAVAVDGMHPRPVAEGLGQAGIFVWDGHYYALEVMRRLGVLDSGGLVRIGFVHYNTLEEVDRVVYALEALQAEVAVDQVEDPGEVPGARRRLLDPTLPSCVSSSPGSFPGMDSTYTVAELNRVIARALERAFPEEVWVSGEIRDLKRAGSGHVYFTLVDAGAGEPVPQLPVVLFAGDKEAVNRALVRVSAGRMVDGMQVRIRGTVGHQPRRGLVQLRMRWIDTEYTLGRLAAERREVLEGLAAAGLLVRQVALPMPVAPGRIGLVTSVGSAAHADFLAELRHSGFGFVVLESHATVQGVSAADSIVAALAALAPHRPDVVALIRGGGAQTDLAVFDSEPVARAVATAPFPVLTGIGHEIDETVSDRVAARAVKTPTACAQLVVGMVRAFVERLAVSERGVHHLSERVTVRARRSLDDRARRLGLVTARRLGSHRVGLARAGHRLDTAATGALRGHRRRVDTARAALAGAAAGVLDKAGGRSDLAAHRLRASPRGVAAERRRLEGLAGVVRAHDPQRMLARGWSVTRTADGVLVRSPDDVCIGDHVVTTVAGGAVRSVVAEAAPDEGMAR